MRVDSAKGTLLDFLTKRALTESGLIIITELTTISSSELLLPVYRKMHEANYVNQLKNQIMDINVRHEWVDGNYEPVYSKNGEPYQFYAQYDKKTGEERYLIAKYLFNGDYVSRDVVEKILGHGEFRAK